MLPLPVEVGEAIAAYLRRGRPSHSSRSVFLTAVAPIRPLSGDGVALLVRRACDRVDVARIGPHRLRYTLATGFHHGLDAAVVALWLGHEKLESVNAYIHADPTLKQRAMDRLTPLNPAATPGRYKPSDDLLAFLERL